MAKVTIDAYRTAGRAFRLAIEENATVGAQVGTDLTLTSAVTLLSGQVLPAGYVLQPVDLLNGLVSTSTVENGGAGLYEPIISPGTTAQFWRGDKTFTDTLVGPLVTYAYQFTKLPSNPAAVPTQALYQDDGTNYKDGTLVWDNYLACTSSFLSGAKGNEQDAISINGVNTPVRIKSSTFGGTATILVHQHSTTNHGELYLSRSNSNGSSHAAVTNGMTVGSVTGLGWASSTSRYLPVGDIVFDVDSTGTIGTGSMPGRIKLRVTPDGAAAPVDVLTVTNDQVVEFEQTPNVNGSDLAIAANYLTSSEGTWTPTFTNVANLDATPTLNGTARYTRIGGQVTAYLNVRVDPTAASTLARLRISLPVASAFTTSFDCVGVISNVSTVASSVGEVRADSTNDEAECRLFTTDTTARDYAVVFSYFVL